MSFRFEPNPNFERGIERQPEFQKAMATRAAVVRRAAEELAPYATGYYRKHLRQRGSTVVAADPFWHLLEYGSRNNPPYAPLRRAVIEAGLRLDERLR